MLALAVAASLVAAVCDACRRVLPNPCCALVAACGLVLQAARALAPGFVAGLPLERACVPGLPEPLACVLWAAGVLIAGYAAELGLRRLRGKAGLGLGDVKLAAAWACVMGPLVVPAAAVACLAGACVALVRKQAAFALGPWLVICFIAALALCGV